MLPEDEQDLADIREGLAQLDAGLGVDLEVVLQKAEAIIEAAEARTREMTTADPWECLPSDRRPGIGVAGRVAD